jgi:hypothetical protein
MRSSGESLLEQAPECLDLRQRHGRPVLDPAASFQRPDFQTIRVDAPTLQTRPSGRNPTAQQTSADFPLSQEEGQLALLDPEIGSRG